MNLPVRLFIVRKDQPQVVHLPGRRGEPPASVAIPLEDHRVPTVPAGTVALAAEGRTPNGWTVIRELDEAEMADLAKDAADPRRMQHVMVFV